MAADGDKGSHSDDTASANTELGTPVSCICCDEASCRRLWHSFNNYWRLLGLLLAVIAYLLIGGAIFNAVERSNELRMIEDARQEMNDSINGFVQLLTNSTNLTEEEAVNLTEQFLQLGAAAATVQSNLDAETNPIWDYSSAVFFASTVITTIGYGTIAPATATGQILFIFYAIIGIPLALLFLTQIGGVIEVWVNRALRPVERRWGKTASRAVGSTSLLLTVLIFFMLIPAVIYTSIETWNYRESVYYTVVTLTTVGFGDFVPSTSGQQVDGALIGFYKIVTSIWLWMGLALMAALITEIQGLLASLGVWCHKTRCCGVMGKLQLEKKPEEQELAETTPPATPTGT